MRRGGEAEVLDELDPAAGIFGVKFFVFWFVSMRGKFAITEVRRGIESGEMVGGAREEEKRESGGSKEKGRALLRQPPPLAKKKGKNHWPTSKTNPHRYSSSLRRALFLLSESHCGVLFPKRHCRPMKRGYRERKTVRVECPTEELAVENKKQKKRHCMYFGFSPSHSSRYSP